MALFNETDSAAGITAAPAELGLESAGSAKDLWTGDRTTVGASGLGAEVPAHGTAVFRASP